MYSQNDEEKYILEAAGPKGLVLDIGAYDGVTRSNSRALLESNLGWRGILVEPSPGPFLRLAALYRDNPRVKLVHALVGQYRSLWEFWMSEDGLSTTRRDHFLLWRDTAKFDAKVWMPSVSTSDLFAFGTPDVVSIDTEGTSARLFLEWPWHLSRPKVFVVETDGAIDAILKAAQGYREVYRSNENTVLVHGD